jgi:hypothetical protein
VRPKVSFPASRFMSRTWRLPLSRERGGMKKRRNFKNMDLQLWGVKFVAGADKTGAMKLRLPPGYKIESMFTGENKPVVLTLVPGSASE